MLKLPIQRQHIPCAEHCKTLCKSLKATLGIVPALTYKGCRLLGSLYFSVQWLNCSVMQKWITAQSRSQSLWEQIPALSMKQIKGQCDKFHETIISHTYQQLLAEQESTDTSPAFHLPSLLLPYPHACAYILRLTEKVYPGSFPQNLWVQVTINRNISAVPEKVYFLKNINVIQWLQLLLFYWKNGWTKGYLFHLNTLSGKIRKWHAKKQECHTTKSHIIYCFQWNRREEMKCKLCFMKQICNHQILGFSQGQPR